MIQAAIRNPVAPAVGCGHWSFDQISKRADPSEIPDDLIGEPFHAPYVATIATACQHGFRVNRDRIILPDGDNAYMDVETLRRLMAENGESQTEIGRMIGLTPDKMSKVMKRKRRLTADESAKLASYYGMQSNLDQLPAFLPIIGLVSAGAWREAVEHARGWMPSPDKSLSRDAFVVEVEGDSMDLVAQEGEGIIVDPRDRDLLAGRYYVLRNEEGETTFKRYMENPARFEPCSSNPDHKPFRVGEVNFSIIGRARKRVADL